MSADLQPALDLIKRFEGCRLTAYQDIVGVWTIGWGTTGPLIHQGLEISQMEADQWLLEECEHLLEYIYTYCLGHDTHTENQICALISFAYNLGSSALRASTLLKKLNSGDLSGAADEFLKWNHAGGKVVAGLTARRAAERELFLKPET